MTFDLLESGRRPPGRRWSVLAPLLAGCVLSLAISGCSQVSRNDGNSSSGAEPQAADYVQSPILVRAERGRDGQVSLAGRAAADSIVRLSAPEGQSWGMTAGPDGDWSFAVPIGDAPRMLALTAEKAGRAVHADGAIMLLPAPAVSAVVARAGYGAIAVDRTSNRPVIVALDYDGGGGAMVSGVTRPGTMVRLLFDNVAVGEARADPQGRFTAPAVKQPLAYGQKVIRVDTPEGSAQLVTTVTPPATLAGQVYRAARQPDGWRVDWRVSEHATQTTIIFDSAEQLLGGASR